MSNLTGILNDVCFLIGNAETLDYDETVSACKKGEVVEFLREKYGDSLDCSFASSHLDKEINDYYKGKIDSKNFIIRPKNHKFEISDGLILLLFLGIE